MNSWVTRGSWPSALTIRGLWDRRVGQVERPEDRPLRPGAVAERVLLHHVLDVHVAEQWPLAGLADVDEPLLDRLVLLVCHLVFHDRLVDAPQDVADQLVGTL